MHKLNTKQNFYLEMKYFPDPVRDILLNETVEIVFLDKNTQGTTTYTDRPFVVCLNCDRIKTFEEFIFIAFHEFAHAKLWQGDVGKDRRGRELGAWKLSMDWFGEYKQTKSDPAKRAEKERISNTRVGENENG